MSESEEWRWVVGYEGIYEVSSLGRVRSVDRRLSDGRLWNGRLLKLVIDSLGYQCVRLTGGRKGVTVRVHRLVCAAFHGDTQGREFEVLHIDGQKLNNAASNLRWGTRTENNHDILRHGRHNNGRKTHCPRGHELVEPNLVLGALGKGHRQCLACSRARACIRRNPSLGALDVVSDEKYREIVR